MIKRKFGRRSDWKRVLERRYTEMLIKEEAFEGYVTLLHTIKVTEPLFITYETSPICLVDDGYYWMQHFPEGGHYSLTTMFDSQGTVIQWYIDICKEVGYSPEKGPWIDDLILDIVLLPSGRLIELDVDEFVLALNGHSLTEIETEVAMDEFNRLKKEILQDRFGLLAETPRHFESLKKRLDHKD